MIKDKNSIIEAMFKVGAHFGLLKSRRHPSAKTSIFGIKNNVEIFDLEKTSDSLEKVKSFINSIAQSGKQIVFVSGKSEISLVLRSAAEKIDQPFVAGRWIGGTLTNFGQIKKRIEKYENRLKEKENGDLSKYTKKERLLIDREIDKLNMLFGGIVSMKEKPGALIVVDPKKESIAVKEAKQMGIPVVAIANSDCNFSLIDYPIAANDSSASSVAFFLEQITDAYSEGKNVSKEIIK